MKRRTMTQHTVTRSALGLVALGVMAAVLAVPTPALAGAADVPGLNAAQAAAGKNKNRGANKGNNRSNRGAKKNNRSNNNRGAKKNNRSNRSGNKGAKRNNNNNRSGRSRSNTSGQTRTLPTPRFTNNPDGNNTHYQAMGRDHADYGKNNRGSRGHSKNSRGHSNNRGHNSRNNHNSHNNHKNSHGHNSRKNKHVTKNYYGSSHGSHYGHYDHGYYKPRVGISVHIGSGGVYAGHNSHYGHGSRYGDNTYCRTSTYTSYGYNGTTTYRHTTCSTDAYGGYAQRPVYVNKTYVYGNTDYDNYRDYQNNTYANTTASSSDYTQVVDTPAPEPALERVGLVGPWADLVNAKPEQAQDIFDQIAKDYGDDGLPQLGFAIASAQRGQYQSAAAAVERALEIDPASVDRMPDSVALRNEIRGLADELRRTTNSGIARGSFWLTVAAFDYLSGDSNRARAGLDQAAQNGADSAGVRGLRDRIER